MPRWARILLWCAVGVFGVCLYLWYFGVQTVMAVQARYWGWRNPIIWKVPVELTDQSISKSAGRRLSYLGYEFEVPWNDLDEEQTKIVRAWQLVNFRSGNAIVLMKHEPLDLLENLSRTGNALGKRYGDEFAQVSDYETIRLILEAAPDKITPFSSRRQAVREFSPLVFKQIFMMNGETGVFQIRTPQFRGFQYGNPASNPAEIRDDLYSDHGSVGFVFRHGKSRSIFQAEINRVIQTVRLLDDQTSGSDSACPQHAP